MNCRFCRPSNGLGSKARAAARFNESRISHHESPLPFFLILALLLWLPAACSAQLTGDFQFNFTNNLPLWDFSGDYRFTNGALRAENILVHAPSGAITGSGSVYYNDGLTRLNADEVARGRVTHSASSQLGLKVSGAGQFSGEALHIPISGPFKASLTLTLDPTTRILAGTETAMACVQGRGCRTLSTNVTFQLPANLDGSWALSLTVTTSNKIVRGLATMQTSNGRALSFTVRGAYLPASGISRLKLIGTGAASGRRLSLSLDSTGQLQTLRGNLFGQRLLLQ